ncbi:uncharacterized protein LOC143918597 [Arctopsyche grandis]|uniref:uncharacterized protein LOC143918597 n=1 Tax=Arctopsyche grandis TaxID=121162 RepID=UPI00406D80E1
MKETPNLMHLIMLMAQNYDINLDMRAAILYNYDLEANWVLVRQKMDNLFDNLFANKVVQSQMNKVRHKVSIPGNGVKTSAERSWRDKRLQRNGRDECAVSPPLVHHPREPVDLLTKLTQLDRGSGKTGRKINVDKSKLIYNKYCMTDSITLGNRIVEVAENHLYLGQIINMFGNKEKEIKRRMKLGCSAFERMSAVIKSIILL